MFLEILGFFVGIVYLWWEYQADPKVWIASVIMPAISLFVYYDYGLYADFGINIYYLLIAVYGYFKWTVGSRKKGEAKEKEYELPVSHTPLRVWGAILPISLLLWWLIWWILVTFTDSTVPVADAFTTALSIVALWMMARKYAEQWLLWLVVDFVCTLLYWYKGLPFYSVLYGIYTVIAWFGYRKWLKLIPKQ